MYERAITLEEMADIFETATLTGTIRTPALWVNTYEHAALGTAVTLQTDDDAPIVLRSTFPVLPEPSTFRTGPKHHQCALRHDRQQTPTPP